MNNNYRAIITIFVYYIFNITPFHSLGQGTSFPSESSQEKSIAPDFEVKSIDGNVYSSMSLKGKVIVLNFWFVACGPCRKEIPSLDSLANNFNKNTDVIFLAISSLDDQEQLQYFLTRVPFSYELVAKGNNIIKDFNVSAFPTNVVIDKAGEIVFFKKGSFNTIQKELSEVIVKSLNKSEM
jgi:thiol-disulfide isomerase/thioredoxin